MHGRMREFACLLAGQLDASQVSVKTFVAGGDAELLSETSDLEEAARQLTRWQQSICLTGPDGGRGNAVPIAAVLENVSSVYIPTLRWGPAALQAYRLHTRAATKAQWDWCVRRAEVEAAVNDAFDSLVRAGMDRGAAHAAIEPGTHSLVQFSYGIPKQRVACKLANEHVGERKVTLECCVAHTRMIYFVVATSLLRERRRLAISAAAEGPPRRAVPPATAGPCGCLPWSDGGVRSRARVGGQSTHGAL